MSRASATWFSRHEAGGHQIAQDVVGASARGGQIGVGRIFGRRLEQARQHRRLGQRHILDGMSEIEPRRRLDAEHAAAHIGAVEIKLEDVALGQPALQPEGEKSLVDFSRDRALVGQEQVFRQLLGQGRAALHRTGAARVDGERAGQTDRVDAEMVEEAAVLGRQQRLDHMVGILLDRHGIFMKRAAPADLHVVAVAEDHGEIGLFQPVVVGRHLERGLRQHDQDHAAEHAERQPLAGDFDRDARNAAHGEILHEAGEIPPNLARPDLRREQLRIEPGIRGQRQMAQTAQQSGFVLIGLHLKPSTRERADLS